MEEVREKDRGRGREGGGMRGETGMDGGSERERQREGERGGEG